MASYGRRDGLMAARLNRIKLSLREELSVLVNERKAILPARAGECAVG